jgi:5-methyltetrahydrofolate--homocysteine methyltransferase
MLDRPVVRVTASAGQVEPEDRPGGKVALFEWLTDPEQVLPRLERRIAATCYAGDAFPWVDPVHLGLAAIQSAYLGAPYHIDPGTLTAWTEPVFEDWARRPSFDVDPANGWWRATQRLLSAGAQRGVGRYAISIPDLQGGGEILALLRGSQRLAMDLVDCPEQIAPALEEINATWLYYFQTCYALIHRWQEGWVDWLGIWSDEPAVTVECDFSVMVSPEMFRCYFLPAVAQQTKWIGRAMYHLDGPGAVPHLPALLDLPDLRAIQWVPTPDRPRQVDWIPLLSRIQAGGKSVVVDCGPDEVLPLLDALDPRRLLISTHCSTPSEAKTLLGAVNRQFGFTDATG